MIVSIKNFKGGSTKSTLAIQLSRHEKVNASVYTNENNGLFADVYDEFYSYKENIELYDDSNNNIIYDFGGFSDKNAIPVLQGSDCVIVPTLLDINSIKVAIDSIQEIAQYNENILIVLNAVKTTDMAEKALAMELINENFSDIPVMEVRHTKGFNNAVLEGVSIFDLYSKGGLNRSRYKGVVEDLNQIVETIKG